jgi:addiction module HigA family antidote
MMKRKPTHPGVILLDDVIKPLGITITEAAQKLGVSRKPLSELVNQKYALRPEMALRITESTIRAPKAGLICSQSLICGMHCR